MSEVNALGKLIEAVEAGTMPLDGSSYELFGDGWLHVFDSYHGSLDAALALHEALLPGWGWEVRKAAHGGKGSAYIFPGKMPQTGRQQSAAETPARAWLLAILRAYRSVQA